VEQLLQTVLEPEHVKQFESQEAHLPSLVKYLPEIHDAQLIEYPPVQVKQDESQLLQVRVTEFQ